MLPVVSGGERETVRTATVTGVSGPVAEVARAPPVRARDAVATAREEGADALRAIPVRDLLDRVAAAGALFRGTGAPAAAGVVAGAGDAADADPDADADPVSAVSDAGREPSLSEPVPFDAYRRRVTEATGLPAGWVANAGHWLAVGLRHAGESLRAQSPTGGLGVYDEPGYARESTVGLAFAPRVRVLGAAMPANDPTVYAWPALALAMKVPVVVRPSDRDPFTAVRLARCLVAAGVPESAVHVLPGDREVGETVVREADHALAFGDDAAVDPYRGDPTVEAYGPGESVAVVGREPTPRELDSLARGVVRSGGRACFDLTRVVATGDCDADALARGLAARLADATVGPLHDATTDVPGFVDADAAAGIDARVDDLPGTDVTARVRVDGEERLVRPGDGAPRLRPTVLRTPALVPELPFPFVGVTERDRGALPDALDGAYLGVVVGDAAVEERFVRSPAVRKVYAGRYPATVDLRETHETYLGDFLYETTTYDRGTGGR